MRHHFGDFLDRAGGYWTIIPNRERYIHRIGEVPAGSPETTILMIGKEDSDWSRVTTLPNLEELTLHEPTPDQLQAVGRLRSIRRLRITHARPSNLDFIREMSGVEELVLEYVSGFCDLSPLRDLKRLRSVHLENLRRVADFSGLSGVTSLKYLAVYGTTDWQQPIDNFEFLRGLPQLEVFALWQVKCRAPYPAMLPALGLKNLKRLRLHGSYLAAEEYALLEEGLSGIEGAAWGPYRNWAYSQVELPSDDARVHLPIEELRLQHPEVRIRDDGKRLIDDPASSWFEFTGRGAGRVKCGSSTAEARCREKSEQYEELKGRARALIERQRALGISPRE